VFYIEEEVCSQQADTLSNHMFRNFEYIDSTSCLAALQEYVESKPLTKRIPRYIPPN